MQVTKVDGPEKKKLLVERVKSIVSAESSIARVGIHQAEKVRKKRAMNQGKSDEI